MLLFLTWKSSDSLFYMCSLSSLCVFRPQLCFPLAPFRAALKLCCQGIREGSCTQWQKQASTVHHNFFLILLPCHRCTNFFRSSAVCIPLEIIPQSETTFFISSPQFKQTQPSCLFSLSSTNINFNVHCSLLKSRFHLSLPLFYTPEMWTSNLHLALILLHLLLNTCEPNSVPLFFELSDFPIQLI